MQKDPSDTVTDVQASPNITDKGSVRLGGMAPSLPLIRRPAIADTGKIRLGGMSPSIPPVRVAGVNPAMLK